MDSVFSIPPQRLGERCCSEPGQTGSKGVPGLWGQASTNRGVPSAAPGFSAETQNSALWFLQLKAHLSPLQSKARKASADSGFNCIQVRHDSTGCVMAIGTRLTLSILGPYLEMGGSRRDPHCGYSLMLALGGYHWWLS